MAPHLLRGGCFFFPSSSVIWRRTRPTSVPLLLLSSAFLLLLFMSTVAFLLLILPTLFNFLVSNAPLLYRSLHSWLSPPYLYLVINGIIVSIAASSRFHHPHPSHDHLLILHASDDKQQQQPATTTTTTPPPPPRPIITSSYDDGDDYDHDLRRLSNAADADISTCTQVQVQQAAAEELVIDADLLLPLSIGIGKEQHSIEHKPLLSARFTAQRKGVTAGGPSTPKEGK